MPSRMISASAGIKKSLPSVADGVTRTGLSSKPPANSYSSTPPGAVGARRYFEGRMMAERKRNRHLVIAFGAITVHVFHQMPRIDARRGVLGGMHVEPVPRK